MVLRKLALLVLAAAYLVGCSSQTVSPTPVTTPVDKSPKSETKGNVAEVNEPV